MNGGWVSANRVDGLAPDARDLLPSPSPSPRELRPNFNFKAVAYVTRPSSTPPLSSVSVAKIALESFRGDPSVSLSSSRPRESAPTAATLSTQSASLPTLIIVSWEPACIVHTARWGPGHWGEKDSTRPVACALYTASMRMAAQSPCISTPRPTTLEARGRTTR